MADETQAQSTDEQAQQVDDNTDWQAKYEAMREHMRDWEKKAKANQSAADELEKLKSEQMTEQEKANARAEKAEAELNALKAEQQRTDAARRLSTETGVPFEMLMYCADEEAMADFAKTYAKENHVSSAPAAVGSRVIRGNEKPRDNGAVFAELADQLFKH